MKKIRKEVEKKLLAFGYSDDYIIQSCAEEILENESEISKIIIRIEDDDLTIAEAIAEAIKNKEDEKLTYDMSVSEYIANYCF